MKTFLLLISITCGIILPYGHDYTFLIRYFLMAMLFFSFLDIKIEKEVITKQHFIILMLLVTVSVIVYVVVSRFNVEAARAVFIAAIGPTAIAAPVIISLKKGKVEFVVFSLLLNNMVIALLIPFILPVIMASNAEISVNQILLPVVITITVPFIAARLTKYAVPKIWKELVKWKDLTFYLLMLNIYIATSKASYYISNESPDHYDTIILIGILTALTCALLFILGHFVGGKKFKEEASFSLGQKNNGFTIWIALTYMNPVSVIGPVFYVMFQNIFISWKLYKHNKAEKQVASV